ncbi:MAG: PAS domain S-box protein [Ferruginibacter sp.]|nr:PAS domain S-box protein [Cytophagales bacterium]
MLKKIRIGSKIIVLVLSMVLVAVLSVGYLAFDLSKQSLGAKYQESLRVIAYAKAEKLESFFRQVESGLAWGQSAGAAAWSADSTEAGLAAASGLDAALATITRLHGYSNVYLTSREGKILYRINSAIRRPTVDSLLNGTDPGGFASGQELRPDSVYYSRIFKQADGLFLLAASSVPRTDGNPAGMLVYEIPLESVFRLVRDTTGLGATGEVALGRFDGTQITYLTLLGAGPPGIPVTPARLSKAAGRSVSLPMREAVNGKTGSGLAADERGTETLAAWCPVVPLRGGLVVKVDAAEVFGAATQLRNALLLAGLAVLLVSLGVSLALAYLLTSPLLALRSTMVQLGQGVLPDRLASRSEDEIGEMTDTVNSLVDGLKKTANFAHKIGNGNFDADFKPMSGNDTLGLALLGMRDNIQDSAKRDEERNWIVTGVAEVGDILRATDNLEDLGERITAYLTRKINAVQGALYVVNDDDRDQVFLEMIASYAYNKKKYLRARFRFAEGLVGQAAIEQDTLLRTEIPDQYVTITSGLLGDRKPKCLLIVPLITVIGSERVVYGALEMAGFEKFSPRNVQFVKEISEIIARTVFNIKVNATTRTLLQMSQKQSEELQQQQEVLRQNAEEMEATQEELKRSNGALEDQVEEVNRTQKRMQVLLENASEVITIYERDGRIRYISSSVERILGYSPNELIGLRDVVYVHPLGVDDYERMFRELLEHPDQRVTVQFSYQAKNGDLIWLEASGINLLHDPAIAGLVLNTRDITERRRAEKESRMRGQMQALSENSPDLITRFNKEGKVFYINPVIESYTGRSKEEYLLKSIEEVMLNATVVESWGRILRQVMDNNEKVSTEMNFPSVMGDCVMQVNAIPEYNENQGIESVLLVSHDITDRKRIELEIQAKSKKITESINYAKRIQGAILPNTAHIQGVFSQSFILYKPRDVVSGDFPWFQQKGDDVYIAAVDCTGHGVPGALISLIGYFLLNNIVTNRDASDPGLILDQLDEGVTRTLKQDSSETATRDGMDIALCRINQRAGTLEYAGAHRPLYFVRNGELTEVKGDKFPVGGAQYKTRVGFTTTRMRIQPGDAVFFCSDGFPDQFGGPDDRKFSPKRIRDLITENIAAGMEELNHTLDREFEEWKGPFNKQTDDVLMIGIKF